MTLRKINENEEIPYDLLLLADETKEAIDKYIHDCEVYILDDSEDIAVAVFALYAIDKHTIELKNIAIHPNHQNKGLGSKLIGEVAKIASNNYYKTVIVGTPTIAKLQLNFYQKNGFVKYAVKEDFFIINYSASIFDAGIQLKDMQMLKLEL
jgi:ribosomal protein S18 acetylase RimI-like enzyme